MLAVTNIYQDLLLLDLESLEATQVSPAGPHSTMSRFSGGPMAEGIRRRGGSVEFLRFVDEGHGLVKQGNKLRAYPAIAEFLDRHLGPA